MCLRRSIALLKSLVQKLHRWGRSSLWVCMWRSNRCGWANSILHIWHVTHPSCPRCVFLCVVNTVGCPNPLLQIVQMKGLFPVWEFIWYSSSFGRTATYLQNLHGYFLAVWYRMWSLKCLFWWNDLSQCVHLTCLSSCSRKTNKSKDKIYNILNYKLTSCYS